MVLNLDDSGTGSLRAAIAAANASPGADTITFAPRLEGTLTLTSGGLLVTDSLTIDGPGVGHLTVSGNNASRVFELNPGASTTHLSVTINGLTISNGSAVDSGGGILNEGSSLTLSGDVLAQNVATGSSDAPGGFGGGLRSMSGTLTLTDCTISGNQALGGSSSYLIALGGGIAVDATAGSVTITGCTFSGNRALAGNGGTGPYTGEAGGAAAAVFSEGGPVKASL
jgi:hypothetical protein